VGSRGEDRREIGIWTVQGRGICVEKQYNDAQTQLRLERIVLVIFSVYTVAMFIVAQLGGWNIFMKEIMFGTVFVSWGIWFRRYRDHCFRAKFISAMTWVNLVLFALHTRNFLSMLSIMAGMIVLLGIFCIPWIIYQGIAVATVVFLYHGLIVRTMAFNSVSNAIGTILQLLAIYTVAGVTLIVIRTQQETRERLIENIHELELAEQSKDDFVVNISHEIRTPINAVCGMSEAILQENLPVEVRRDVVDIQTAGRNLLSTVSNILDFSELESGKMELAEESYNITSTITDIINMALTLQNGKKLELIVDCDANLPSNLLGDEQKFRRIVMNILDNAMKFTREGGIILRIKSRKEEYGINLLVSIRDSGIGMEPADLEKIFTSFSQVNSRRNREEGGIGLGLAITQALVYRMGGFITVKSTPGVGSEFRFAIPQKVLDETPIVSIKNKRHLYAAFYINMEKYNYSIVREGYDDCLHHITEQLGIMIRDSKNLTELKRRLEHDNYSHVFISWTEYCEDKNFFEQLARELTVVLILDYGQETQVGSNMLRIYKPFTILSIAAVFNGRKVVQRSEPHMGMEHRFIAPKAKILVVDDNAMNLKVMARLLLPYQIKVIMAGGGQEALDKLDSMDFDCVFLDHMMPEMDGVETLHRIRNKPGAYFQTLTVIAFTANAIGGAREMFLAEGFDDFIAKPIELSVLERMLRRYIPLKKQIPVEDAAGEGSVPSPKEEKQAEGKNSHLTEGKVSGQKSGQAQLPERSAEQEPGRAGSLPGGQTQVSLSEKGEPDVRTQEADGESKGLNALMLAGINLQQGLTYCGDLEGFQEILCIYHSEGEKRQRQLQQFYQEQDWKNYVITVHALKSNSKSIGADGLAELAKNLEMAGKENRIEYILEHHEELMEKHEALQRVLGENPLLYPEGEAGGTEQVEQVGAETDTSQGSAVNSAEGAAGVEKIRLAEQGQSLQADGMETVVLKENSLTEINEQVLMERLEELRGILDSFESEGLGEKLEELAGYRYGESSLAGLAEEIREKTDEFDFLGAAEVLAYWRAEHFVG